MVSPKNKLPTKILDAHHHFLDTSKDGNGQSFQAFLGSLVKDEQYSVSLARWLTWSLRGLETPELLFTVSILVLARKINYEKIPSATS